LLQHVHAPPQVFPESEFTSILVPMKLGAIGEEMIATAVKLARDRDAHVEALFVIRVPLDKPLEAELHEQEEAAAASLAEARLLGSDNGVEVQVETIRARSIGDAIVGEAQRRGNDLIVVAAVAVLLADGRVRAAESALRGARRSLPRRRDGGGRRGRDSELM
jgi:nucleotide-binding universal stress UspA family protein